MAEIVGGLAMGLLTWGGRVLSRRFAAPRPLPPAAGPTPLETAPEVLAVGTGERSAELAELLERARWLEGELEVVRQRIRALQSKGVR